MNPSDGSAPLPLFPLSSVLLPGAATTLRIFEPRYLDLVRKCQRAAAPFGVVALRAGHEVRQAGAPKEKLYEVGTLAHIEQLQTPQPGLITLRCRGAERFRILRSQRLPHGLWVADVQQLPPDPPVAIPPDLAHTATALAQLQDALRERTAPHTTAALPTAAQLHDCGWVANRWAELLPVPLELKQNLMALDNPLLRLELVDDVLQKLGIV